MAKKTAQEDAMLYPIIPESSTSESTGVKTVLDDYTAEKIVIPDYQRDANQWDNSTKSLFIESVINNITTPSFFFEPVVENHIEKNYVIDGQQRLTTLIEFYTDKLSLVEGQDAAYFSPQYLHYAGKRFSEMPEVYKDSFLRYRLTIIKLRSLGSARKEVFRRINQGGTPLSGQDIRLAYYGDKSSSIAFLRVVGVFDKESAGGKRFIANAKDQYKIEYPWDGNAYQCWQEWIQGTSLSIGQRSSEMFLWSLIAANLDAFSTIMKSDKAIVTLECTNNDTIDNALDIFCAQLQYQDRNPKYPPVLYSAKDIFNFFCYFSEWFSHLSRIGAKISRTQSRYFAVVIGSAYRLKLDRKKITDKQWQKILEFIQRPTAQSQVAIPRSRGRWSGEYGYAKQLEKITELLQLITQKSK